MQAASPQTRKKQPKLVGSNNKAPPVPRRQRRQTPADKLRITDALHEPMRVKTSTISDRCMCTSSCRYHAIFAVEDSTGRTFIVQITRHPSCSCPDFCFNGIVCTHMYYVYLRELGLDPSACLPCQTKLGTKELKALWYWMTKRKIQPRFAYQHHTKGSDSTPSSSPSPTISDSQRRMSGTSPPSKCHHHRQRRQEGAVIRRAASYNGVDLSQRSSQHAIPVSQQLQLQQLQQRSKLSNSAHGPLLFVPRSQSDFGPSALPYTRPQPTRPQPTHARNGTRSCQIAQRHAEPSPASLRERRVCFTQPLVISTASYDGSAVPLKSPLDIQVNDPLHAPLSPDAKQSLAVRITYQSKHPRRPTILRAGPKPYHPTHDGHNHQYSQQTPGQPQLINAQDPHPAPHFDQRPPYAGDNRLRAPPLPVLPVQRPRQRAFLPAYATAWSATAV